MQDTAKISNIRVKGSFLKISNSEEKAIVLFDLKINKQIQTDSLQAILMVNTLQIDGKLVRSNKVRFTPFYE